MQRLKISREGIVLIKSFEGFRPRALQREDGGWIIGYGHTLSAREGATVSEADAELLLHYDLIPVARAVNDGVATAVNQHQFDALASFAFSVGVDRFAASDVLQRLNAGAAGEAADAMVGWPEPILPEATLRRRAAERALFVADPAAAVTLADLLSAPLPPPVPAAPIVTAMTDARAAAVASLLGEAPGETTHAAATTEPGSDPAPAEASVEAPVEVPDFTPSVPHTVPATEVTSPTPQPDVATEATIAPDEAAALTAAADTRRYAPYAAPIVGALPDPVVTERPGEAVDAPTVTAAPAADEPPLVLTPLAEDDASPVARPVWPPEDRPVRSFGEPPLFEGEPDQYQAFGPVLRHEAMAEPPARFDWGETGAFLIMGAVGLVTFGMSMAALRLASQQSAGSGETAMIGWVLAFIGVSCVSVSAFNLYRRWGRVDEG